MSRCSLAESAGNEKALGSGQSDGSNFKQAVATSEPVTLKMALPISSWGLAVNESE